MGPRRSLIIRKRAPLRAATLADVARIARVSPMTASRALNQAHLVATDKAERVRAAAARLAYVPNRIAGGLASQRSRLVIAVVPGTLNPVFADLIHALRQELLRSGHQLFLGLSDYDMPAEDELVETTIGHRPDGIVLTGVVHSPQLRFRLAGARIPVVETWDLTPTPIDMLVGFSNEKVGASAAEHLLRRGSRKPALIVADDHRAQARGAGFAAAAAERGIAVAGRVAVRAPTTLGMGREGLARLLTADRRIDAVFCSSDQLATGVLFEAAARGIRVPGRLAVMGFGDLSGSAHTHPSLTTVAVDGARIGREAVRLLLERLAAPEAARRRSRIVDVGSRVVARESA